MAKPWKPTGRLAVAPHAGKSLSCAIRSAVWNWPDTVLVYDRLGSLLPNLIYLLLGDGYSSRFEVMNTGVSTIRKWLRKKNLQTVMSRGKRCQFIVWSGRIVQEAVGLWAMGCE